MKEGWETKKLIEIADIRTGKWDADHATEKGKYRFYTCAYEFGYCNTNRFNGESLILPGNGVNVGEVFYYHGEFDAYQRTYVINNIKIFPRYLYYHMQLYWRRLGTKKQYGSATNFIKIGNFKEYDVEFPSSEMEQKRIVEILDGNFAAIDKAIANVEMNLRNSKILFENYLKSLFSQGWLLKTLKEISIEFGRGKSKHRPRGDSKLLGGKYPLIQTGDVSNSNHWITSFSQTYNEVGLAQSKLWPKGTVCIAIVGSNVAETAILNFDSCFPDSVIGIIVDETLANNEYVEYLLQSFKSILKEKGKGTARDNINMGTFENQKFPFPQLSIQKEIVEKLNFLSTEIQQLQNIYQQKLDNLNELRQSILQKAFSGELIESTKTLIHE